MSIKAEPAVASPPAASTPGTGTYASQLIAAWRVISRNRLALLGGFVILVGVFTAIFAPLLATHDPYEIDIVNRLRGPGPGHWLGTDVLGRDTFSRLVYGARTAFQVAIGAVALGAIAGIPLGAIAGFYGRRVDAIVMRFMDSVLAFPGQLLAIALVAALGGGLISLYIAIGVSSIPQYARIVRGVVLSQKEREYVEAARMVGESNLRVLFGEILPNCVAPIIVTLSFDFAHAILIESSLSFLGLGFPPPTASWGLMLKEISPFLELQPLSALFPGLTIAIMILGFNLFGDGLRDLFDPRHYEI
ncbi:MAG: transporter permease [Chloroflexi bacterium]|nr:transporter permease [Chloroflexota bacterium]